jgi:hypothetical protein
MTAQKRNKYGLAKYLWQSPVKKDQKEMHMSGIDNTAADSPKELSREPSDQAPVTTRLPSTEEQIKEPFCCLISRKLSRSS